MTLPQNRETLAERSNLYTDWYNKALLTNDFWQVMSND